jgi:hypothetical protein
VKRGLIQSLHNTASLIHQKQDLFNNLSNLGHDLQLNDYPHGLNDSVIYSKGTAMVQIKRKSLWALYIPYVTGVPEKFECIGNRYNIRTIFKITLFRVHSWKSG